MSKESLIKQLYEQSIGKTQENVSRHIENTNTLLDRTAPADKLGKVKDLVEIPLEMHEYKAAVTFKKTLAVINRSPLLPGEMVRLVEIDHLMPTGKTTTTIVKDVIIGTGTTENGILSGKMVVEWEANIW